MIERPNRWLQFGLVLSGWVPSLPAQLLDLLRARLVPKGWNTPLAWSSWSLGQMHGLVLTKWELFSKCGSTSEDEMVSIWMPQSKNPLLHLNLTLAFIVPGSFATNEPTPVFHHIMLRGAYGLAPVTYNLFFSRSQYYTGTPDESGRPFY